MMRFLLYFLVLTLLTLNTNIICAEKSSLIFENLFKHWTIDFNNKNLSKSCALFSKHVSASYQGQPRKNYRLICDGFKRIFAQKNKRYRYKFNLNNVYHCKNLAAVRITWFLEIQQNHKTITKIRDEGLDILQKNAHGNWQIINFIAYPIKKQMKHQTRSSKLCVYQYETTRLDKPDILLL